jgi:hypothetical protein
MLPMTVNENRPVDAGTDNTQARTMQAVAAMLRDNGVGVRFPAYSEGRCLSIVNAKRARSDITVHDNGYVMWEYWPFSGAKTEPANIAAVVLRVIGGRLTGAALPQRRSLTLKGAVGRELRARGLDVSMLVYEDSDAFEVTGEIVAVNPTRPEDGRVWVTDEGSITWECYVDGSPDECALTVADAILAVLVHGAESCWPDEQASPQRRPASSLDAARAGPNETSQGGD